MSHPHLDPFFYQITTQIKSGMSSFLYNHFICLKNSGCHIGRGTFKLNTMCVCQLLIAVTISRDKKDIFWLMFYRFILNWFIFFWYFVCMYVCVCVHICTHTCVWVQRRVAGRIMLVKTMWQCKAAYLMVWQEAR